MKQKKMVHVNKLRKLIGRLEVKVAQNTHSHHPTLLTPVGVGSRARREVEKNPILRTEGFYTNRLPSLRSSDLAEFESLPYHLLAL